jgi:uncharacterized membrane protein YeaQ/YmgE (transglycosylase-associated protein family)
MMKRLMIALVGAGLGSLLGLFVSFLFHGTNVALFVGAVIGAAVPLLLLGAPGH